MKTMNGKSMEDIFTELSKDFPENVWKILDYPQVWYLPYEAVEERLNQVVGHANYDFILGEPQLWDTKDKEAVVVKGQLILHCDDGSTITRSSLGSAYLIRNAEGKVTSVGNVVDSAAKDVFKRCGKAFGIGVSGLKSKNNKKKEERKKTKYEKLKITSNFYALPNGGAKVNSERGEIIFWKDIWNDIVLKYPEIQIGNKINQISFYGFPKTYKEKPQIEFCGFS